MSLNQLKVISLVPSWTETLIDAGVNVVGRTKFCIHPNHLVKNISQVGGTKNLNLEKIKQLQPDVIILDKQENTKEMSELILNAGLQICVTDVVDFETAVQGLQLMHQFINNSKLLNYVDRYRKIIQSNIDPKIFFSKLILHDTANFDYLSALNLKWAYVIWKQPYMVVGDNTFIGHNLKHIGIHLNTIEKYPEISESDLKNKFCLFSSEPFPFEKYFRELQTEGFKGVVVDGEKLSWFGIRNLTFLESCL